MVIEIDFLCLPPCPLWFWHLNLVNHEGHKGTRRKSSLEKTKTECYSAGTRSAVMAIWATELATGW